jgi:glutamine synthetase
MASNAARGAHVVSASGLLTVESLRSLVGDGQIDTVLVAMTDMQGRLQGKRCDARFFLDEVLAHGAEACDYLLAVDVDMRTVGGYAMSSWDLGYGDLALTPDLSTLRVLPWHPGTALILCDVASVEGSPIDVSPRQMLRRQLDRLAEHGLTAMAGTELEFMVFNNGYEAAQLNGYRDLEPPNRYNVDYSLIGTGRIEPLLRAIRQGMVGAGMYVESAKGECNLGQHEIVFRYADALTMCDNHVIYKTGAKEIAAQLGKSLTFMAKYDEREGNSCHIHVSLRTSDGESVFAGDRDHGFSVVMERFLAGQLACLREFAYFFGPNVNSYKRLMPDTFAPTAVAWGMDNRTCSLRVVGHRRDSLRFEHRVPGGDVNPYVAVAAIVAAGLYGIEHELPLESAYVGNAYRADLPRVPSSLREAAECLAEGEIARKAFGTEVVEHYLNAARIELAAFDSAVTDWERVRGFERL